MRWGWSFTTLAWCGFSAALVALTLIDWDTTLLPDDITLPLLWAGLLAAVAGWTAVPLADAVVGAAAGYLSLWLVYWGFKLATGKAQIEGLEPHHTRALQEILFYAELGDAEALRRALTQMQPDEVALVRSYRSCSEDAKVRLIQQAALLSAGLSAGADKKKAVAEKSSGQNIVGDNAIQIGSVTGKARIKNR